MVDIKYFYKYNLIFSNNFLHLKYRFNLLSFKITLSAHFQNVKDTAVSESWKIQYNYEQNYRITSFDYA